MTGYGTSQVAPWGVATAMSAAAVGIGLLTLSMTLTVPSLFGITVASVFGVQTTIFYYVNRAVTRESGRQQFTVATGVTVLRGSAILVLAGFVVVGRPDGLLAWIPALLFGAGALFDGLDGAVARATDTVSAFGARLDVEVDALALLVGTAVTVRIDAAPTVFLLVGLARYAFVGAIALRESRGLPVKTLPPRLSRRILGALGMIVVFVVLTPGLDQTHTRPLAVVAMIPFLLGFCRDWLLVTGRL